MASSRNSPKSMGKAEVLISELVPPFKNGDWVTVNRTDSLQFLPKDRFDRRVVQIGYSAEYVGKKVCQSGWQLFGVDSDHFRKATPHDIREEMDRIQKLITTYQELWGELNVEHQLQVNEGKL